MAGEQEKTFDLDQVIKEGMQQFTGQESPMTLQEPGQAGAGTPQEKVGSEPGKEEAGKGKEGEGATPGKDKGATPEGQKAEAEEKATQERMRALEDENRELKKEKATAAAIEVHKKADAEFGKSVEEFSQAENKKALAAIDKLDPDDFESPEKYQEEVAKVWAQKETAVARHVRNVGARIDEQVGKGTAEPAKGAAEPSAATTTEGAAKPSHTWDDVTKAATDAKVDPKDPDFLYFCRQAPKTDEKGSPLDFSAQVDWAIKETQEHKRVRDLVRESRGITAEQIAAKRQEIEQPMERGSTISGPSGARETTQVKPVSLNEALDFAAQQRTL